jgi:hypothetical protein
MARCDIFYLKKPLPKNWKKYFSARFSWSLPAVERLAQHTHGEIIERINRSNCLARDSSDKRGQDRIGLTRLRCFVAKKEEKYQNSNIESETIFCTAHAQIESGNSRLDFKFNFSQHLLFRK